MEAINKMKNIAIYGAGGYGEEIACLINAINKGNPIWNIIGYFDDDESKHGINTYYGPIIGGIKELNNWENPLSLVIAIGTPCVLYSIYNAIYNDKIDYPNLISPDVTFHDKGTVQLGKGNVIFYHSIISCFTKFGDFNLLNNDVFIGHNSILGSFNVINPSARISGNVSIGERNFIGVGSIVLQGLKIGNNIKLSAGSCLYRNTKDDSLYMGNPAILKLIPKK